MLFLRDEKYSNTRIFDRRKSEYSNSGSQCQLSPLHTMFSKPIAVLDALTESARQGETESNVPLVTGLVGETTK